MGKNQYSYPPEYRARMVELVRAGRAPEELGREFEPTAQSIRNWVKQADLDEGRRTDGVTSTERKELGRPTAREPAAEAGAGNPGKSNGLVRSGDRPGARKVFELVSEHQENYPIVTMCQVLGGTTRGVIVPPRLELRRMGS